MRTMSLLISLLVLFFAGLWSACSDGESPPPADSQSARAETETQQAESYEAGRSESAQSVADSADDDTQQPDSAQTVTDDSSQSDSDTGQAVSDDESGEQARVQVIRGRASLGDPNAPVVIEEYSDFL